jgi:hypothetical protein
MVIVERFPKGSLIFIMQKDGVLPVGKVFDSTVRWILL